MIVSNKSKITVEILSTIAVTAIAAALLNTEDVPLTPGEYSAIALFSLLFVLGISRGFPYVRKK